MLADTHTCRPRTRTRSLSCPLINQAGAVPLVVEEFGPGEEAVGTACLYGEEAVRATRGALLPLVEAMGAPLPFVMVRTVEELAALLQQLQADPARP